MPSLHALWLVFAMCLSLGFALESFIAEDSYEAFPSLPGSRYKLYTGINTWHEGYFLCQADGDGSHLVVVNSQEEAEVVKSIANRTTTQFILVGINDIATEGTWVTVEGELVSQSGYDEWFPGDPYFSRVYNCGLFDKDALFHDNVCDSHYPFVCEKPDP